MTQLLFLQIIVVIYTVSSVAGVVLFGAITHSTYKEYSYISDNPPPGLTPTELNIACAVAWRNFIIAFILSIVFKGYIFIGVVAIIRHFQIFELPFLQGSVSLLILAACNVLEMSIAVILYRTREAMKG